MSLYLTFDSPSHVLRRVLLYAAIVSNLAAAYWRMNQFWTPKTGRGEWMLADAVVPDGYQRGVDLSKKLVGDLKRLGLSWVVVAAMWGMMYVAGGV